MTDRGVSTAMGYVLLLGVTVLLVAGIGVAVGGLMEDQQERSASGDLRVVGDRVAADLMTADRLVQQADDPEVVNVTTTLPRSVSDVNYVIDVEPDGDEVVLALESRRGSATADIRVANETPVVGEGITGGPILITYDEAEGRLVIRDE